MPDATVILWDLTNPTQPRRLDPPLTGRHWVTSVAFAPDGHALVTASTDNTLNPTVILWDLTNPTQARSLDRAGLVGSVTFAPDGHTLATASGNAVFLWDLTDPTQPRPLGSPLTGHTRPVTSVAFAPDGHTLAIFDADSEGSRRFCGTSRTRLNPVAWARLRPATSARCTRWPSLPTDIPWPPPVPTPR